MTRIEGFWVYWGGEHYVWAEREVAPNHKYRFEVSADWKQIGRFWMCIAFGQESLLIDRPRKPGK
jgi:hypothetical protein